MVSLIGGSVSSSVLLLMFEDSLAISSCTILVLMQGIGSLKGPVLVSSVLVELLSLSRAIIDFVPSTLRLSVKRFDGGGLPDTLGPVTVGGITGASRSRPSGVDPDTLPPGPDDFSMLNCFLRKPGRESDGCTSDALPREHVRLVKPVRSSGARLAPESISITVELRLVSPSIERSLAIEELSMLNELLVSFELCLMNLYGCMEYSVSVLEFFCKLSHDFLYIRLEVSKEDGFRYVDCKY